MCHHVWPCLVFLFLRQCLRYPRLALNFFHGIITLCARVCVLCACAGHSTASWSPPCATVWVSGPERGPVWQAWVLGLPGCTRLSLDFDSPPLFRSSTPGHAGVSPLLARFKRRFLACYSLRKRTSLPGQPSVLSSSGGQRPHPIHRPPPPSKGPQTLFGELCPGQPSGSLRARPMMSPARNVNNRPPGRQAEEHTAAAPRGAWWEQPWRMAGSCAISGRRLRLWVPGTPQGSGRSPSSTFKEPPGVATSVS